MKILLINDYATATGGAEINMLILRNGLQQQGHDVRIFATYARSTALPIFADYTCFGTTSSFRTLLQTTNPWAFYRLQQILAEFKPDLVHVGLFLTQLSPFILPLLKGVPALYHILWPRPICLVGSKILPNHSDCQEVVGLACYRNKCLPFYDWLPLIFQMKLWHHWRGNFNLIVTNSYSLKQQLVFDGIEPVEVIWDGTPIQPMRPPLKQPPIVVFAGRLVKGKGVDILIEAFACLLNEFPTAKLLIAGDGVERRNLVELANKLRISSSVEMLGYLSHAEMEQHFSRAWVQVIPSRWNEAFGRVAIEAMMRGTAVVASSIGGLQEIVRHSTTGFLVTPSNIKELTETLGKLLKDPALAEQMGKAGRKLALNEFSAERYVKQFVVLYQKLTCSK